MPPAAAVPFRLLAATVDDAAAAAASERHMAGKPATRPTTITHGDRGAPGHASHTMLASVEFQVSWLEDPAALITAICNKGRVSMGKAAAGQYRVWVLKQTAGQGGGESGKLSVVHICLSSLCPHRSVGGPARSCKLRYNSGKGAPAHENDQCRHKGKRCPVNSSGIVPAQDSVRATQLGVCQWQPCE